MSKLYLSYIKSCNTPKNKYQVRIIELARQADRMLTEDPEEFMKRLGSKIENMWYEYQKCGKVTTDTYSFSEYPGNCDIGHSIGELVHFQFLEIEGRFTREKQIQPFIHFEKGGTSNV